MNIIEKIFNDSIFDELNNLKRWNGLRTIKNETVAEHTYMVSLFTSFLIEEMLNNVNNEDSIKIKLFVIRYSIFHDFDEVITGDIKHSLKHGNKHSEEIKNLLESVINSAIFENFNSGSASDNLIIQNVVGLSPEVGKISFLKKIVKVSDWLSMLFFIKKEKSLGNKNLDNQYEYCIGSLKNICANMLSSKYCKEFNCKIIEEIYNSKTCNK